MHFSSEPRWLLGRSQLGCTHSALSTALSLATRYVRAAYVMTYKRAHTYAYARILICSYPVQRELQSRQRHRRLQSLGVFGLRCLCRCHVKMGTPQNGDPGSPYSRENGDPGPYIPGSMGTRVPIFLGVWGPGIPIFPGKWGPPWKNGDPLYGRPFSGNLGIPSVMQDFLLSAWLSFSILESDWQIATGLFHFIHFVDRYWWDRSRCGFTGHSRKSDGRGSPFSHWGPHFPGKMGTRGPHFHGGPQNFMTPALESTLHGVTANHTQTHSHNADSMWTYLVNRSFLVRCEEISAYSAFQRRHGWYPGVHDNARTTPLSSLGSYVWPAIAKARARALATVTSYYIITCC